MQKENKMGVMPIPGLVISMSVPIMISMLVQSMYNIVDSIFVARINEAALTATSLAYSAQILQIAVAVGTGVGTNALVSRKLGAKKYEEADEAATTGLFLTIASSLLFVLWGLLGSRAFIGMFTKDPTILDYGTSYLRICQIYATGIFLGTFFQRILQATGRTLSSMLAQMAGAVTNLILDPIMIFGYFGCPAMGIAGATAATVIGQWIAAILGLVLHVTVNKEIHFRLKGFRFRGDHISSIYKVGIPTILTQAFGSIMVALMNLVLILFSSTAVAFFGVYFKLQSFLVMPDALLTAFSASDAMKEIGIPALRIICIGFLPTSVTMMIGYTLSGLGNGMVNMISTALRQCFVLLPCVLLFGSIGGIRMIWFAFWIAEACALIYALRQLRKNMQTVRTTILGRD